ncbi:hypothetical protein VNI00_012456 [Paramarasmius palmivorus]|uniref:DUF6533 domain-containing protein n=1 Tax=Paramarasmius palmivorus TaxID=297713 RepID=A0AAW0C8I4_9AGAR
MAIESDPQTMLEYMLALRVVVFLDDRMLVVQEVAYKPVLIAKRVFNIDASMAILVFDYFVTLGQEVHLVWTNGRWNIGKILFFLTRYVPFVAGFLTLYVDAVEGIGLSACAKLTRAAVYCALVDIIIAEIILTLRVSALWGNDRKVIAFLIMSVTAASSIAVSQIGRVHVAQNTFGEDLYATYGICPPYFANSNAMTTCYVVLVSYETVILTLTVIKAIEHCKVHLPLSEQPQLKPQVIQIVNPDVRRSLTSFSQMVYHITSSFSVRQPLSARERLSSLLTACSITNIVVRYRTTLEYVNLFTSLQPVIHSVLTSRMMLHLKGAAKNAPSTWQNSTLRFGDGHNWEDMPVDDDCIVNDGSWFTSADSHRT